MSTHPFNDTSGHRDMAAGLRSLTIERSPEPWERASPASAVVPGRRRLAWGSGLALLLLLLPIAWLFRHEAERATPLPAAAPTDKAVSLPSPVTPDMAPDMKPARSVIGTGVVVARRRVVLRPQMSGRVATVDFEAGDRVVTGQRMARLDARVAEADAALAGSKVANAETAVQIAEIDVWDAHQPLARLETLSQKNFASAADIVSARFRVEKLEAVLIAARQALITARLEDDRSKTLLSQADVLAPFDGIVAARIADVGDIISPGADGEVEKGLAVVLDPAALSVDVDIAEANIRRITPGIRATATLDAYPDAPFPMRIRGVMPEASHDKGTVVLRLDFDPATDSNVRPLKILPGMAVKVVLSTASLSHASSSRKE